MYKGLSILLLCVTLIAVVVIVVPRGIDERHDPGESKFQGVAPASDRVRRIGERLHEEAMQEAALKQAAAGQLVVRPKEGEPEWVLLQFLVAAGSPDREQGFVAAASWGHSSWTIADKDTKALKGLHFSALGRKVRHILRNVDDTPSFTLMRMNADSAEAIRLFAKVDGGELPHPFVLERDHRVGGAWRVTRF